MNAQLPVAEIRFSGDVEVRPFRRGTYLAREDLETMIEKALGDHYRFGDGWRGFGDVTVLLYDRSPPARRARADAGARIPRRAASSSS